MSLSGLLPVITEDPQLRRALEEADAPVSPGGDLIAPPALRPFLVAALAGAGAPGTGGDVGRDAGGGEGSAEGGEGGAEEAVRVAAAGAARRFVLAVTATAREAEELTAALGSLLPDGATAYFPPWETLPHERLSPRSDTSGQRLAVLRRLAHPDPAAPGPRPLRVVPPRGPCLPQPMVGGLGELEPVRLRQDDSADLDDVVTHLVEIGYTRTELVEKRGDLAVRGGILDVFPPTEEHPVRIEFFGDTIEEIRFFRVADQRSLGPAASGLWAPPCRELLLTPDVRSRARQLADEWPGLSDVLGKVADGITVEGMEAFAPVLADRMELLSDHVPAGGCGVACAPERIRARATELVRTSQEFLEASWVNAAAGGEVPIDLGAAAFRPITEIRDAAGSAGLPWWTVTPFVAGPVAETSASPAMIPGTAIPLHPAAAVRRNGEAAGGAGAGPAAETDLEPADQAGRETFQVDAGPAQAYRGDTTRGISDIRQWG